MVSEPDYPTKIALTLVAQAVLMNERKEKFPFFALERDFQSSKHLSPFFAN